jgi:hypothetical protein
VEFPKPKCEFLFVFITKVVKLIVRNMNAVISLCHFCEMHGPRIVFTVQAFRDGEPYPSVSSAGSTKNSCFSFDFKLCLAVNMMLDSPSSEDEINTGFSIRQSTQNVTNREAVVDNEPKQFYGSYDNLMRCIQVLEEEVGDD